MKKLFILLCLGLVLTTSKAGYADSEKNQDSKYAVIGVVNLLKIQSEAQVYQDIRKKRDAYLEKYKEEIAKKEQEFRKIDQDLAKDDKAGNTEGLETKKEEFVKQLRDFQSKVQTRREKVGDAFINITSKVQMESLAPVIEEVAQEKGVNIVLNNAQIIFFAPFMDMTDEVLEKLNNKISKVDFPDPDKM